MEREKMLEQLQLQSFCAVPTTITSDMGLQFDFVNSDGYGSVFGVFGEWPAIILRNLSASKWGIIFEKLKAGELVLEDISGTDLEKLYNDMVFHDVDNSRNIANIFAGLLDLPSELGNFFYCLYDLRTVYSDPPEFFAVENDLINRFEANYCSDEVSWDDLDDEEMEDWLKRIDDEFSSFPFISYFDD